VKPPSHEEAAGDGPLLLGTQTHEFWGGPRAGSSLPGCVGSPRCSSLREHGTSVVQPNIQIASLDHALWFHGNLRMDDWLLYDMESPCSGNARGLALGRIFSRDGRMVASVTQEGLIRERTAEK
jgi:hypothetical protein